MSVSTSYVVTSGEKDPNRVRAYTEDNGKKYEPRHNPGDLSYDFRIFTAKEAANDPVFERHHDEAVA